MVESFGVRPMCPLKGGCGRGKTSCALAGNMPDSANSVQGNVQTGMRRVKVKKFILSSFFLLFGSRSERSSVERIRNLAGRLYLFFSLYNSFDTSVLSGNRV